ncbi:MAG: BolA family transcriptional regulator [Rickettsiales bacterium]|nr:BolA family transcriptional regulator [Rickettsiales bacterium]
MKQRIEEKLKNSLNPNFIDVINNSHLHKGHLGDDGSGETHFRVAISSLEFDGLNRVQKHQKINKILQEEFEKGLHALEIKILD